MVVCVWISCVLVVTACVAWGLLVPMVGVVVCCLIASVWLCGSVCGLDCFVWLLVRFVCCLVCCFVCVAVVVCGLVFGCLLLV